MATKKGAKKENAKGAKEAKPAAAARGTTNRSSSEPAKAPAKKPAPPAAKPRPAPPKPTYAPPPPPKPAAKAPAPSLPPPSLPPPSAQPTPEPDFVKKLSFADRKAAMEALAEKAGVPPASAPPAAAPRPPPTFVKETSAADRKAAMEKVVVEQGVSGLLSKAPWKRPGAPAPPPPAPPTPAAPAPRDAPRVTMTKAPLEQTTGRNPPSVVILDSNALMMQFQFHIDIEKEVNRLLGGNYKMIVPQIVVDELGRLAKEGAQKEAAEARMAVELAKTFQIVESPGDGDTGILRVAEKMNAVVVTNDKRLRAQLRAKGLPNIYMRSRAFLTIEGHIPGS